MDPTDPLKTLRASCKKYGLAPPIVSAATTKMFRTTIEVTDNAGNTQLATSQWANTKEQANALAAREMLARLAS